MCDLVFPRLLCTSRTQRRYQVRAFTLSRYFKPASTLPRAGTSFRSSFGFARASRAATLRKLGPGYYNNVCALLRSIHVSHHHGGNWGLQCPLCPASLSYWLSLDLPEECFRQHGYLPAQECSMQVALHRSFQSGLEGMSQSCICVSPGHVYWKNHSGSVCCGRDILDYSPDCNNG
jgi:hypothetical protein